MVKKLLVTVLLYTLVVAFNSWWNADYSAVKWTADCSGKVHKEMRGPKFRKALEYHGIHDFEVRAEKGVLVFYREGRRCELYKYLENRK